MLILFMANTNKKNTLLQHLSPLGWEHINLTGDYIWRQRQKIREGKFRPLRPFLGSALLTDAA